MDADGASLTELLSVADCALLTAVCVWLLLSAEEVPGLFEIVLPPCCCATLAGAGEVSDCAGGVVLTGAYITAGDASCCAASLLAAGIAFERGAGTPGASLSVSPSLCSF